MNRTWKLTVCGVRGSAPRPAAGYLEYGGNTVCALLEYGNGSIILDAGSGLSALGVTLADQQNTKQHRRFDLFLSHLHMDHIIGLFHFQPFFDPKTEIHLYGSSGFRLELERFIGPPFWPVGFSDFPAKIRFHELEPGAHISLDGLDVYTMEGNHPNGSLLYRLEDGEKSLTYALDCEINETIFPKLAEFSHKTDLIIWDSCFVAEDLRTGWGHSTWKQGRELLRAASAKTVLMTHYGWDYSDSFLRKQEQQAEQTDSQVRFAKEGMVITL